jgi:hypothetical protein
VAGDFAPLFVTLDPGFGEPAAGQLSGIGPVRVVRRQRYFDPRDDGGVCVNAQILDFLFVRFVSDDVLPHALQNLLLVEQLIERIGDDVVLRVEFIPRLRVSAEHDGHFFRMQAFKLVFGNFVLLIVAKIAAIDRLPKGV